MPRHPECTTASCRDIVIYFAIDVDDSIPLDVESTVICSVVMNISGFTNCQSTIFKLVIYALSDFLIMILSWLVKQSLRAFLFQEVQP